MQRQNKQRGRRSQSASSNRSIPKVKVVVERPPRQSRNEQQRSQPKQRRWKLKPQSLRAIKPAKFLAQTKDYSAQNASNGSAGTTALVAALAMPTASSTERFPTQNSKPTVSGAPFLKTRLQFAGIYNAADKKWTNGETFFGMSRDPLHAFFHVIQNPTNAEDLFTCYFCSENGATNHARLMAPQIAPGATPHTSDPFVLPFQYYECDSGPYKTNTTTPRVYANRQDARECIWINTNQQFGAGTTSTLNVDLDPNKAINDLDQACLYMWDGEGWLVQDRKEFVVDGPFHRAAFNIGLCGYYSVTVTLGTIAATRDIWCAASLGTRCSGIAIEPLPLLTAHMATVSGLRINACSVLCSQRATNLTLNGGTIVAIQLPYSDYFFQNLNYDLIGSKADSRVGIAAKGMYGFLKPCEATDFSFVPITSGAIKATTSTNIEPPPIDPASGWMIFGIQLVPTAVNVYSGADFQLTMDWNIEYTSTSPWLKMRNSTIEYYDLVRAVQAIGTFESFHENPLHAADVAAFVKRVAGMFNKYGVPMLKALAAANPTFAPLAALM